MPIYVYIYTCAYITYVHCTLCMNWCGILYISALALAIAQFDFLEESVKMSNRLDY